MPPAKPEPGRDPEMAERTQKLNVAFALTSIGLLGAVSLMIWADYNREWKQHQIEFNKLEVKQTRGQIEQALGKVDAKRRKELEDDLARAAQEKTARRAEISVAAADLAKLEAEWYRIDQDYRFTKAKIDVARYEYEEALHQQHPADKKKAKLDGLEAEWKKLRVDLDDVIDHRAAVTAKCNDLEKSRLAGEKLEKELYAEKARLEEKLHKIEPGLVSTLRNLPVLDMLNPSLKINQIMPAYLMDDVIFTGTPKVDRCTTCHLGIDKKGYENEKQPYRTHPHPEIYLQGAHPIDRIGCTSCHLGRGRGTSFVKAAHTVSTAEQETAWGRYSGTRDYHPMHHWDIPMTAREHTESQCAKCHQGVVEVPGAPKLNLGIALVERYGCFGCHKIKGWENLRKVGPDLTRILSKTDEEWIFRWVKEPKSFRPTRMPQVWDVRQDETPEQKRRNDTEANAVVAYLVEKSGKESYPAPPSGDLDAGRHSFETIGCLGCHRVGDDKRAVDEKVKGAAFRTHGPNLDGTGSKVGAGWLFAWIRNPRGYWHETRMPDLRLSEKEAADITAYLMSLKNQAFRQKPRPAIDVAIRDDVMREHLIAASMPLKQVEEKLAGMDDHQRTLFVGEKTIARYGCFGCHTISGFEKANPIGVELTEEGSKLVERLDFGFEQEIPHTLPGWVERKLLEPRTFDRAKIKKPEELLRMPKFHFSGEEAKAIVTGVMSFTKEQVPQAAQKQLSADERYVEKGARLVREYNCRGCHQVGENGGSIREVVRTNIENDKEAAEMDDSRKQARSIALSPPILYNAVSHIGEGARVHTDWLHGFLQDPSNRVRPWLDLRMPTFHFTEDEINTITRYFAAQDKVPYPYAPRPQIDAATLAAGKDLFEKWQCVKCHVVAGKLPNQDKADMAPDLAGVPQRLRADWLSLWLADPGRIMPGTRMPANFPEKPQENAFPEILGGEQSKQIEAVRAYLLTLGAKGALPAPASRGGAGK